MDTQLNALPTLPVRARTVSGHGSKAGYYPGTEEAHTNPTRQRGECLRASPLNMQEWPIFRGFLQSGSVFRSSRPRFFSKSPCFWRFPMLKGMVPQSPRWRVGLVCAKGAKLSCRGNTPRDGWGRRPQGDAPRSEASALGARWLLPARPQPPRGVTCEHAEVEPCQESRGAATRLGERNRPVLRIAW